MGLSNLTTRLNVTAVSIVLLFMLFLSIYQQWMAFEERKTSRVVVMDNYTAYLERTLPALVLLELEERDVAETAVEEQVLQVNGKLQPALNAVYIPPNFERYGVYSVRLQRVVAMGPELDKSLLLNADSRVFGDMFTHRKSTVGTQSKSVIGYGAEMMYFVRPIQYKDEIIGYIFVCDNLDKMKKIMFQNYEKTLLGGSVALAIVIMLFQEIFIRLKKELALFAEAIVEGRGKKFQSKIKELNPLLQYITEQTDRMARLDRLNIIGEMAASIGHEVRNPLTTVRGFLQYIGNKPEYEKYKSHFWLMIEELDRANGIITEFLSLAKNKVMDFKECHLNAIIREVTPLLEADTMRHKCELVLDLRDIPPLILDANSIRQLILNIVRNGIEAMPQGGKLTISTCNCDSAVKLIFCDEGIGIPPEIMDKLGTPFFTTKDNGVGLGLAVCHRIIHRHNAKLLIESQQGSGSVFTIIFTQLVKLGEE
ncbi:MAG: kinE 7 [Firmicutes bacterium]|nr:kinE 7 [Bacillota bacterium]